MIRRRPHCCRWLALSGLVALGSVHAATPVVAIIIDDLGYRYADGLRAVALPAPVACAVIPDTPHGATMARAAHAQGKEILLHLPMQPMDPERPVGEYGIDLDTTRRGVTEALAEGMRSVPYVTGVNNHMGSLITRHPGHMTWLMLDLHERGLFFVDSVTSESSVALGMALEQGVAATRRDVFLDEEDSTEAEVAERLEAFFEIARRRGQALAIGHPFPATMAVLERELPRLQERGLRLVPVRELISLQESRHLVTAGTGDNELIH